MGGFSMEEAAGVMGAITSSKVQISFGSTHPDIVRAPASYLAQTRLYLFLLNPLL